MTLFIRYKNTRQTGNAQKIDEKQRDAILKIANNQKN